jgi:hypothetical protein
MNTTAEGGQVGTVVCVWEDMLQFSAGLMALLVDNELSLSRKIPREFLVIWSITIHCCEDSDVSFDAM